MKSIFAWKLMAGALLSIAAQLGMADTLAAAARDFATADATVKASLAQPNGCPYCDDDAFDVDGFGGTGRPQT